MLSIRNDSKKLRKHVIAMTVFNVFSTTNFTKLRPLLDILISKCSQVCRTSSVVYIDEPMIPFKDRSNLKQYMPMKTVKRGYKVSCLADSTTGFINFRFIPDRKKNPLILKCD